MPDDFFKTSNEGEARKLCPHIAAALDVLQGEYGFRVEHVGWVNPKSPELVVTLDQKIPVEALERSAFEHLQLDDATFSFRCVEHDVSVWSGR